MLEVTATGATLNDGTSRTCYFCSGGSPAETYDWWLNSWTLPVTADKRLSGLAIWLADVDRATAYMEPT